MTFSVLDLFTVQGAVDWLNFGLGVANDLGLITTTWRVGDPTKVTFNFVARALAARDGVAAEYAKSAFLSSATGEWKTIVAREVYGIEREEAQYATSTLALSNGGGGHYDEAPGDIVFKSTLSGKTYRSTSQILLTGLGSACTVDVVADEAGSDSSAALNEIDDFVTTLLLVTVTGSTVAVGIDEQSDDSLQADCEASRGALSPDGPDDAYDSVVRSSKLTGVLDITRSATEGDSGDLTVTVYVAGPSGPVAGASVTAAQSAVETWATPIGFMPTVVNAIADPINITASIRGDSLPLDAATKISAAQALLFAGLPLGRDTGYDLDPTTITTATRNAVPEIEGMPVYTPAAPVHIAAGHVPVLGSVTITVL